MEAGEKEQRLAFEEVANRNIKTVIDHSDETRKMVKELEVKIQALQNIVLTKSKEVDTLKKQLAAVQTKIFVGGTTSGD